ncbi:MAG TPA: BMP family protein [Gemmatimonadaceae bacterium]|nr:BMP family protein [Gemmatimonadaceae bacterium]
MHRRRLRTTTFALLASTLAACSTGKSATDSAKPSAFKVALLTPGPISDQSWNGGAYQGLLRIRDSLGAQISHIQTKTPAEFEENFRQYGAEGYTLVIGHGSEFQDAAKRVAPQFPHTMYLTTSGATTGPNLAGISFGFAAPSYFAGMLAASVSKTGKIGAIAGQEIPPVAESFRAYTEGARAVNPKINVIVSYIGNWDDVSAGKEQALAQLAHGVDVIFQNADAAGLGVFQAAREHKNAYVIGSNSNQNTVAPDVTLASVVIDLPLAFYIVAKEVKDGTFKPGIVELGTGTRVVMLVRNPALESVVPAAMRTKLDSLQNEMVAGRFTVPATDSARATKS